MQETLLSFGLIILSGLAVKRIRPGKLGADALRNAINVSVLNVFLPSLCLVATYRAGLDRTALLVPATAWVTTLGTLLLSMAVYGALARRTRMSPGDKGMLVIAAAFGNVTYLGLPVLRELYGFGAIKYALFYDLLATTPILWLVGAPLAARYGSGEKIRPRQSLRTVIALPPIWGIFLGMALNAAGVGLPSVVLKSLDMLGGLVVPLMIFSIGLALSFPRVRHAYVVLPAVAIKLFVAPLVSYATARTLGLTGVALSACLLEGAMPTMVLSLLIAARFGLSVSLAAFVIVVTTALSFFTLQAAVWLGG